MGIVILVVPFKGEETIDGVLAEKWQLVETVGQKKNKYTMWMNYRADPDNTAAKVAVPLRYDFKQSK